uniref:Uncharacterized protein LOC105035078 isoform X1 n=1 Tax=Elaeis guineensis var. tenera TaxID=51953 RepID=A0A6I9QGF6_ELAGV|nr:uncharacterized protein LOC105035078 isoform X1 [Elaeis guineensis]
MLHFPIAPATNGDSGSGSGSVLLALRGSHLLPSPFSSSSALAFAFSAALTETSERPKVCLISSAGWRRRPRPRGLRPSSPFRPPGGSHCAAGAGERALPAHLGHTRVQRHRMDHGHGVDLGIWGEIQFPNLERSFLGDGKRKVPLLGGALCACTWHFFYNSESLEILVALQAALTVIGNITMCIAAFRIFKASQEASKSS